MKNVKFASKAGSADQEAVEKFLKYLLSVIQEKGYGEEQVFKANETDVFYKDVAR